MSILDAIGTSSIVQLRRLATLLALAGEAVGMGGTATYSVRITPSAYHQPVTGDFR